MGRRSSGRRSAVRFTRRLGKHMHASAVDSTAVLTEPVGHKPSVAVLMTCFNRREQTLRCLQHLFAQTALTQISLHVVLLDDASTDGTAEAVREAFPDVQLMRGTGQLYWNRGMRMAFAEALRRGFDFYLWL